MHQKKKNNNNKKKKKKKLRYKLAFSFFTLFFVKAISFFMWIIYL